MNNTFLSPRTTEQLIEALKYKKDHPYTFFIAGGTDFVIRARKNKLIDFSVIDLTQLDDLKKIEKVDQHIEIGAAVTMHDIEYSDVVKNYAIALSQAASMVGSVQIRNRATIGGNVANAAHCADMITTCSALKATAILLNSEGRYREMPVEQFTLGSGKTVIEIDEVLVKIKFPDLEAPKYTAFYKIGSRKAVTISKINCALQVDFADQKIKDISIYVGSIAPKAICANLLEECCIGRQWDENLRKDLQELATETVDLAIPTRDSRHYKRRAIKGVISEVFDRINEQKGDN